MAARFRVEGNFGVVDGDVMGVVFVGSVLVVPAICSTLGLGIYPSPPNRSASSPRPARARYAMLQSRGSRDTAKLERLRRPKHRLGSSLEVP